MTHPPVWITSSDRETRVKQLLSRQPNMTNREVGVLLYVARMSQPHTVLIALSHSRFKVFLFQAKKALRKNEYEAPSDHFINKNLPLLTTLC